MSLLEVHSFITVMRQVFSQIKSSPDCDIVLSLSDSSLFFNLRLPSSCLRLLPDPSIIPYIMCFRRQFLRIMSNIQLAFLRFIVCTVLLSYFTVCRINTPKFDGGTEGDHEKS